MGFRLGVLAALAAAQLAAQQAPAPALSPAPPPLFSPWYAKALRGILDLEKTDVARLERQLVADPEDLTARLKLMAYHQRADRSSRPEDRAKRAQYALWLIEHHPDSELLHSPVSRFAAGELTVEAYRRAIALWETAAQGHLGEGAVQWNAATFFQALDPGLYMHYLEATVAADPNHPYALRPLADFYALSILERGPLAARAQAGLEASKNIWVLGNAAYMLQSQYNRGVQIGAPNPRAAELAERYFLRAKALAPNLDRQTILPQLDPAAIARARQTDQQAQQDWQARAEAAAGKIRRLPVEAFPALPATVAGILRARHCTVPQPALGGAVHNVIRGQFFANGEAGWAVFCSADHATSLLAFRNDRDTNPVTVSTSEDRQYLQGLDANHIGYTREITAAGRDFIMRHYRANGGPPPPPIDHQGIDDAFLGKASVTWYFYQGKWLHLAGAD